jgi:hypothetical protein
MPDYDDGFGILKTIGGEALIHEVPTELRCVICNGTTHWSEISERNFPFEMCAKHLSFAIEMTEQSGTPYEVEYV